MLRPLFLTTSLVHGGAERHSIGLMNRLVERGHDCHAVYIKDDTSQLNRIRIGATGTVNCLNARGFFDRPAIARLVAIIDTLRPSVLVAANPYPLMYASLALRHTHGQVPVLATYHTTRLMGWREHVKMLFDRYFMYRAGCLVFVSDNQRRYCRRRAIASRRVEVIHNGVDTEHFSGGDPAARRLLRRTHGFADGDYVIGISAVLRPEKNHLQLLEAVSLLHHLGLPARLLIIGDGPLRSRIEARARYLGIADSVRITGFQQDVRPHLIACDVVALCSIAVETFSLAALEAMAMSRPVVHSDLGGASEMIVPGYNGYLFPVGDTASLVDRLRQLADPTWATILGGNARRRVEERFSETAMVTRYEQLLVDLCHRHATDGADSRYRRQDHIDTQGEV